MIHRLSISLAGVLLCGGALAFAQQGLAVDRLPPEVLDVVPPSARVVGTLGSMRVSQAGCQASQAPVDAGLRRRIVDVAVQEWGFFGFGVDDQTNSATRFPTFTASSASPTPQRRRRRRLSTAESARVATSIAGYWTVTAEGGWIIDRQNEEWNGPSGVGARWRNPWSAAFISWVMCESGLADSNAFQRGVAHHRYIDQAIRSRDGGASRAAFVAFDIGEAPIAPGDMLCSGRRPSYRAIAERRRQLGEGARTHCDIVVKVDAENAHILAIGGNVRSAVSLKILPAEPGSDGALRPRSRSLFAHLKLRADAVEAAALDASPTIRTLGCAGDFEGDGRLAAVKSLLNLDQAAAGAC